MIEDDLSDGEVLVNHTSRTNPPHSPQEAEAGQASLPWPEPRLRKERYGGQACQGMKHSGQATSARPKPTKDSGCQQAVHEAVKCVTQASSQ